MDDVLLVSLYPRYPQNTRLQGCFKHGRLKESGHWRMSSQVQMVWRAQTLPVLPKGVGALVFVEDYFMWTDNLNEAIYPSIYRGSSILTVAKRVLSIQSIRRATSVTQITLQARGYLYLPCREGLVNGARRHLGLH